MNSNRSDPEGERHIKTILATCQSLQEIKQAEERIQKAKSNINQNEKDQVDTQKKLQDQQKTLELVKRKMSSI